ncbi:acyl protein thioesterase family [Anaeramoeba flamelloides]|uniref:Acyl protein thioesterase family n=1 Tax=Anaeramoeba flamelloides TaxID=1746091 RepID=A0ABQ8YJR2_9EUKA|nr:acyl protein thioesterase family [Anaeramoeba flamelloides]
MNRITRKLLSLPALKAHKSTIFLLHGLGDIGRSYFPIAEYLRNKLPNSKFVMPTAGKIPVTLNMGIPMNAWYDIETLKSRDTKEPKYLESSAKSLIRLMESESKLFEKDVDPQFVFAGFSQGAALSFFTAMRRCERKIAAVAMLSGYLIKQQGIEKDLCGINKETPVLMCHGDSDPVVLTEWGKSSYEKLKKLGVNVKFNLYNGLQHSIVLKELDDLGSWLAQILNQKKK